MALVCLAPHLQQPVAEQLGRRGYVVRATDASWEAGALLAQQDLDVAVVGSGMAPADALQLLRQHDGEGGPLLILEYASAGLVDRVLALEAGAADIVDEHVTPRELAARISGMLVRRGRPPPDLVVLEKVTVDMRAARVMHHDGHEEQLSPGQVALLKLFVSRPRTVLTREDILAGAPAESFEAFDRAIDSRIVRLRRKLCTATITTIRGNGYRFDPPGQGID